MKRLLFALAFLFICFAFGATAFGAETKQNPKETDKKSEPAAASSKEPIYVSPKKVILMPGSIQMIQNDKQNLSVEFDKMHPTGNFPVVRIQGIPFKLTKPNNPLEFTWQKAGYEITWLPFSQKVALISSEPFFKKSFSLEDKNVKSHIIQPGLTVETKRRDGVTAKLQVVDVLKDSGGKMQKFSVRTYADETVPTQYQIENNILAPEYHKQYEKGINGEVLYVFTSDDKGNVYVYYR